MNILTPIPVTQIIATTVAEPAMGETEWVPGAAYQAGDRRIRTTTHREYVARLEHSGRMTPPEDDPMFWRDVRATQRYAPFDFYRSTQAKGIGQVSYTVALGFVNAVDLYGTEGNTVTLTVTEGMGGPVMAMESRPLFEESPGLYEYLFAPSRAIRTVSFDDLPIHPDAHITITVSGASGSPVALGIAALGQRRVLFDESKYGGVEEGASAEPRTTSVIRIDGEFGEVEIRRRASSTDLDVSVAMDASDASYAVALIQEVLDVPVSWRAASGASKDTSRLRWLSTFGLGSGRLTGASSTARLQVNVRGFI